MTSWDASRGHRGRATLGGDARWQSLAHALHRTVTVPALTPKHCPRFQLTIPPALASDARSAVGRPARKTSGSAPAGSSGIHSTLGESAQPACTNRLRPSASRAADGRRIRCGTRNRETKRGFPSLFLNTTSTGCVRHKSFALP